MSESGFGFAAKLNLPGCEGSLLGDRQKYDRENSRQRYVIERCGSICGKTLMIETFSDLISASLDQMPIFIPMRGFVQLAEHPQRTDELRLRVSKLLAQRNLIEKKRAFYVFPIN